MPHCSIVLNNLLYIRQGRGGGGRGLANIYPKGSLFGLGVILEIILVPSLGRYGADMVVLDFLPCDECTVTPGIIHLSSLYGDSSMLRKHQTTQFLPLHRGVQSQCMHTQLHYTGLGVPPGQRLDLTSV